MLRAIRTARGAMATQFRRILLVGGNDDGREALRVLLEGFGYVVGEVDSLHGAFMRVLAWQPDIVCLALPLADPTGYAVVRLIRAAFGPRPPLLVAVTALEGERPARQALDAGFDAYVTKPYEAKALLASFSRALPRRGVWPVAGDGSSPPDTALGMDAPPAGATSRR